MKFGSWSYDGRKISLNLVDSGNGTYGGDTASFMPNGEWDLLGEYDREMLLVTPWKRHNLLYNQWLDGYSHRTFF